MVHGNDRRSSKNRSARSPLAASAGAPSPLLCYSEGVARPLHRVLQ